jgi:hypothetical protein
MHPPSSLYMSGFVLHTELTLHADVAIFQVSIPSKLPEQASRASIPSKQWDKSILGIFYSWLAYSQCMVIYEKWFFAMLEFFKKIYVEEWSNIEVVKCVLCFDY